jgi:hypothetical protein
MDKKINIEKLGVRGGAMIAIALIAYFMIMKYLQLIQVLELRVLNFIILFTGIVWVLNKYKNLNNKHVDFFEGLAIGGLTTVVAVIIFAAFVGLYLLFNPSFMEYISQNVFMGPYLTPSSVALVVFAEGMSSGIIISFVCMQYLKKYETGHAS